MRWDKNYKQPEVINDPTIIPAYGVTDVERAYWNNKQERLIYDRYPTFHSDNNLTSGAVYRALEDYKTLAIDSSQQFFWAQVGGLAQTKTSCEESAANAQQSALDAQQAVLDAQQNEQDAEAWATGQRGGIPVSPSDPTYNNNAKYYAEYSAASLGLSVINNKLCVAYRR